MAARSSGCPAGGVPGWLICGARVCPAGGVPGWLICGARVCPAGGVPGWLIWDARVCPAGGVPGWLIWGTGARAPGRVIRTDRERCQGAAPTETASAVVT